MRIWRALINFVRRNDRTATSMDATTEPDQQCRDEDTGESSESPMDAESWDEWWKARLPEGRPKLDGDMHPVFEECPVNFNWIDPRPANPDNYQYQGRGYDLVNSDALLAAIMRECGLKTVLCAGNGISFEPLALATAGFDVTALDISPLAARFAKSIQRPRSATLDFVVGNLLDTTVCPGPFDVIIERRTVQLFPKHERAGALEALAGRLSKVGVFLSLCADNWSAWWPYHETGFFHASESWFREHGWTIWYGAPSLPLTGRVAWLIRSGEMKPPPSGAGASSKQ